MNVEKMLHNEWLDIDDKVSAEDYGYQAQPKYVWLVLNVSDLTATDVIGAYDSYDKAKERLLSVVDVLKSVLYHSNVREHPFEHDVCSYRAGKMDGSLRIVKKEVL